MGVCLVWVCVYVCVCVVCVCGVCVVCVCVCVCVVCVCVVWVYSTDEECRRLHTEDFYDLYSSPVMFRVIKSRRMKWAGHVACREIGKVNTGHWA